MDIFSTEIYIVVLILLTPTKVNTHEVTTSLLNQGSYRQGQVKFKDFSRTNLTIFKDLLLRNTYTYLSIIETLGPATLAFGGGGIIILSLVLSLWVDAVVEVSVLT